MYILAKYDTINSSQKGITPQTLATVSLANKVQGVYRPERNESYMTVNITAKKIQVTQAFSDYATKKIEAKLDRFFSGDADCKVTLSEQKNMITCEVTVRTAGLIFRSEQKAADKNDAFDACIDRIIRQIRKNKTRVENSFTAHSRAVLTMLLKNRLISR